MKDDKKKPGRPKGSTSVRPNRERSCHIKMTEKEFSTIEQKAVDSGLSISAFIRLKALA